MSVWVGYHDSESILVKVFRGCIEVDDTKFLLCSFFNK